MVERLALCPVESRKQAGFRNKIGKVALAE
jgi:hypothetical protein